MGRWSYESRTAITACLVASSRGMIPGWQGLRPRSGASGLRPHQRPELSLRRLVVGCGDQGFLDPVAGAQLIAACLQLPAERQVRLGMSPARRVDAGGGGRVEQLRGQLELIERVLARGGGGLGLPQL